MPSRSPVSRPRSPTGDTTSRPNRRQSRADRRQSTVERRQPSGGIPDALARRVIIEQIRPAIDNGRWPIKRTVGELVQVFATIFADGHDLVAAVLRDCCAGPTADSPLAAGEWRETPMTMTTPGTDEWAGHFAVAPEPGWHEYQIVAWVDAFRTWRRDLQVKASAGQELSVEMVEGALLIRAAAARAGRIDAVNARVTSMNRRPHILRIQGALGIFCSHVQSFSS